ncbi:MAG: LysR family transcriptional regulator [Venatoribacter sp.]
MDTQALKAFLAVAEIGSFSQAAEVLHLTQSAVSKRVQNLEEQLGTSLFDRHNRTISLTESGQALLPKAKAILDLVADTELEIQSQKREVAGKLSLVTSHHIGLHRLPPYLREFTSRFPNAHLDLTFMSSELAYQAVSQRKVELALSTLDGLALVEHESLSIQPLWTDEMLCVCSPTHPLAQQQQLTLADLAATPAILPEAHTITYKLVERVFHQHQLSLYAPMPTNYLETIKMMISVGMGWSMLPHTMLDESLHVLPWPAEPLKRPLGLIQLRTRTLSNAARAFMQVIQKQSTNLT